MFPGCPDSTAAILVARHGSDLEGGYAGPVEWCLALNPWLREGLVAVAVVGLLILFLVVVHVVGEWGR